MPRSASSPKRPTRTDLLRRSGRRDQAHDAYRRTLDLARTEPGQRVLHDRLAESVPAGPAEAGRANGARRRA
ncbi:hypothetical protein GCM10023322_71640 [Rugosimonospora acidiphila]|uniref:Tetratricopeptide repeat protein n=1 Tax=Rugosimonospora acidiphila TaxID=556531 RepID=A0ABP9SL06_9ACTN